MLNILYAMLYFYKKAVLCSSWADEQWRSNALNYTLVGLSVRYCDVPIFLFLQQLFIVPPCFSVPFRCKNKVFYLLLQKLLLNECNAI